MRVANKLHVDVGAMMQQDPSVEVVTPLVVAAWEDPKLRAFGAANLDKSNLHLLTQFTWEVKTAAAASILEASGAVVCDVHLEGKDQIQKILRSVLRAHMQLATMEGGVVGIIDVNLRDVPLKRICSRAR